MTKVAEVLPQEVFHGVAPPIKSNLFTVAEFEANENGPADDCRRTNPRDLKVVKRKIEKKYKDDDSSSGFSDSSETSGITESSEETNGDNNIDNLDQGSLLNI